MAKPESLKCPKCGGRTVSRTNGKTQQRFWGCASYPKCNGTRNTDGESAAKEHARKEAEIGDYPDADDDLDPGGPGSYGDR